MLANTKTIAMTLFVCLTFAFTPLYAAAKPLKVYILVGQSNMQGHARLTTFDHIGMDPKTKPILAKMRGADGNPAILKQVWVSAITQRGDQEKIGNMTAGFGAADDKIGPEFTFGIYMQELVDEPILIIKTAWGGKSLHTDFRPPSAAPYQFNDAQLARFKQQKKDIGKMKQDKLAATGHYYRLMMSHIKKVLADVKRVYPDYNPTQGHELAGFCWFQGWNDMVDQGTYPTRTRPGGYDSYSKLLAQFIRDVRKDLNSPDMPFVIGVMGVAGANSTHPAHIQFRKAMAAPAELPEFKGNVTVVHTANYWDEQLYELRKRGNQIKAKQKALSKDKSLSRNDIRAKIEAFKKSLYTEKEAEILKGGSNFDFHYMGSGKVMALIGKGFAEAIHQMSQK